MDKPNSPMIPAYIFRTWTLNQPKTRDCKEIESKGKEITN